MILEVVELLAITDFFVITSGSNIRQVRTIVEEIEKRVYEATGSKPISVEGLEDFSWVLMDFGDVVVHVFLDTTRDYYNLERLWADAPQIQIDETSAAV